MRTLVYLIAAALAPQALQPALAATPIQPAPELARVLAAGVEGLCAPYLAKAQSPETANRLAERAGFEVGGPDPYIPLGQPIAGAPLPAVFHASAGPAPDSASVEVHLTAVPRSCQVRVKGAQDEGAWNAYLTGMQRNGARTITTADIDAKTTYSHEVYTGGVRGLPSSYTVFVSRWVASGPPPNGMWTLINILPDTGVPL